MYNSKNLNSITDDGSAEKLKKYGSPKKNLIITLLVIIILAVAVILFLSRREVTGITAKYTAFYPDSTVIYVDAQLNEDSLTQINKITNLNIKDLPDLLSRIFSDNYSYRKRQAINTMMTQSFGDSFSFGVWDDVEGRMIIERSLAVFPVKREVKIRKLFKLIANAKLDDISFKGYKITTTPARKLAFSIIGNKLFVADSYDTLAFIIKNNILGSNKGLCDKSDIRNALSLLEKDRIATVLVNNSDQRANRLEQSIGRHVGNNAIDIKSFSGLFKITAMSVLLTDNNVYINSYTPYNLFNLSNKSINQALRILLKNNISSFKPDFLPQNTISFITIKEIKDYIDLAVDSSGLRQAPEYDQLKQFIKMFTSLDFEGEILNILKGNTVIAAIDTGNSKLAYAVVLSNNKSTDYVISKLAEMVPMQVHSSVISRTVYRKLDLGIISSRQLFPKIMFGKISPELYVLGEKSAVESVIDVVNAGKPSLVSTEEYTELGVPLTANYKLLAYSSIHGLKKFNIKDRMIDKISNSIESFSLTVKAGTKVVYGSLKLNFSSNDAPSGKTGAAIPKLN